jgi:hypothetical protein
MNALSHPVSDKSDLDVCLPLTLTRISAIARVDPLQPVYACAWANDNALSSGVVYVGPLVSHVSVDGATKLWARYERMKICLPAT